MCVLSQRLHSVRLTLLATLLRRALANLLQGHHKGKVHEHPSVESAAKGAVCPVVGKSRG